MAVEDAKLSAEGIVTEKQPGTPFRLDMARFQTLPCQRLWDNKVFRMLSGIRLDHTFYPFSLKGDQYLSSGWKRGLDLTVGGIGALVSSVPIALGALAIKINIPEENPFITRFRYGINNQRFDMFKLRSQRTDTSAVYRKTDPVFVGKILRTTSIDELPQFGNVLRGEMSVVGRRPTLPVDYEQAQIRFLGEIPYQEAKRRLGFTDEQWHDGMVDEDFKAKVESCADLVRKYTRLPYAEFVSNRRAKPGLTGLYQILGRKDLSLENRVLLDLAYERNASLGLDIAIIISTVWPILLRKGAR